MDPFIYYYDFEDCFQLDLSGNPLTYVVGSNEELSLDAPYLIYPIEEPNSRSCAVYITASTSSAATHYTDVASKYVDCDLCLSANTQVVTVSGITKPDLSSLNLIADSRFKKGDVLGVNIVYDDSGTTKFINSPAIITETFPYKFGSKACDYSVSNIEYVGPFYTFIIHFNQPLNTNIYTINVAAPMGYYQIVTNTYTLNSESESLNIAPGYTSIPFNVPLQNPDTWVQTITFNVTFTCTDGTTTFNEVTFNFPCNCYTLNNSGATAQSVTYVSCVTTEFFTETYPVKTLKFVGTKKICAKRLINVGSNITYVDNTETEGVVCSNLTDQPFINEDIKCRNSSLFIRKSINSSIPVKVNYLPYDSFQQVVESKGVYYLVEDCVNGSTSVILSHQYFEKYGQIISLPTGESKCKKVLNAVTSGDYSEISGVTTEIFSTKVFENCYECSNYINNSGIDETFKDNSYTTSQINTITQLNDGSILVGGDGLVQVNNGSLYSAGNILKMSPEGELVLNFNSNNGGSLSLYNGNYIYTDFSEGFNFDSDFTVEFWLNYSSTNLENPSIISFYDSSNTQGWELSFTGLCQLNFTYNENVINFESQINIYQWVHIAIVRNSGDIFLYVNGKQDSIVTTGITDSITATTGTSFYIGTNYDKTTNLDAYISNLRICKIAVYTGEFTPQTTPLTITQSSYSNVSYLPTSATTLLMNFENLSSILFDNSIYSNVFYSYKPTISYLAFSPVNKTDLNEIYDGQPTNSFVQLDLPEGFTLNAYGTKISTVYLGTNSYLTFEQGSNSGDLILPEDIPSSISSSGLFISTVGDGLTTDNDTYIRKISTGYTENGESLIVRVEGGYKNFLGGGQGFCCRCITVTNQSQNVNYLNYTKCDNLSEEVTITVLPSNEYTFCAVWSANESPDLPSNPYFAEPLSFRAYRNVAQNLQIAQPNIWTDFTFNTESFDYYNGYNPTTGVYTSPGNGDYTFRARFVFVSQQNNNFLTVGLFVNGVLYDSFTYGPSTALVNFETESIFENVQLNINDAVRIRVARTVNGSTTGTFTILAGIDSSNGNNLFELTNVNSGLSNELSPTSVTTISVDGWCGKLTDDSNSHWVCGDDFSWVEGCSPIAVCQENNVVANPQFLVQGIPNTTIPSWESVNGVGQTSTLWQTVGNNSTFGSAALYTGGDLNNYLQQNCLVIGATYEISFDLSLPVFFTDFGGTCTVFPGQRWVRVFAGSNGSEFFTPTSTFGSGGYQRFTTTLVATSTLLRFQAHEDCVANIPISISNICAIQTEPAPDCTCYEVRHTNAGLNPPQSTWFLFSWRDCSGSPHSSFVGQNPLFPCILNDNFSFVDQPGIGTNEQYAYVEDTNEFCGLSNSQYCIEPTVFPCTCFELKIGNNLTVEFLDCDGNYRFITNNYGPSVTVQGTVCMTSIINTSSQSSITDRGPCTANNAYCLARLLPDPLPPIEGCIVMLNSSTDEFDIFLYDTNQGSLIPISLQGPYIFNNADSSGDTYTDIAISRTSQRVYFKTNGTYQTNQVGPYPASYIGYFTINFQTGTYVSGATINVTPDLPFQDPYDFFTVNHGLEVDLDGFHVFVSSMNYSELDDVQSILRCEIIDSGQDTILTQVCPCERLFDLLPGRRVQGDMCRTTDNKLFITTTDGERVFIEQWHTDGTPEGSLFEFEIVTGLSADGDNQIDLYILDGSLFCIDNNQFNIPVYKVISDYPYGLEPVDSITNLTNYATYGGLFNGAATFPECNSFSFIYPDPRCRPLLLFSGLSNTFFVSRFNFLPFQPISTLNLGTHPVPTVGPNEIAHTFDYETNTGLLWILFNTQSSIWVTTIWEFTLNGTTLPNGEIDFIGTYNRQITLTQTNQAITSLRFFAGLAAIDDNTLIIGTRNGYGTSSAALRSRIVQLNLTPGNVNLNLTFNANTTTMFTLPTAGSPGYTLPRNAIIQSMDYAVDNKLIVIVRSGLPESSNINLTRVILQYPYAIDAQYEYINTILDAEGNGNATSDNVQQIGVVNYNNFIFVHRNQNIGANQNWGGYILNNEPNYGISGYLDIPQTQYTLSPLFNTALRASSTINVTVPSQIQCELTRFVPNIAPVIPTLSNCPVFLNSSGLEGLWNYNVTNNTHNFILLPQLGDVAETIYSYRDVAVCNTNNRLYVLQTLSDLPQPNPSSPWDNNLIWWNVDFETGQLIDGPFLIQLPSPVTFGALRLSEGLEVSPNGNLIYLSTVPIPGEPQTPRVLIYDVFNTSQFNYYTELISFTNGRRVKGDFIRTNNDKLFISTTDGTTIYIEQWTCDDSPEGTIFDNEIEFGPDVYESLDIFLSLNEGVSEFYVVASQNSTSSVFKIDVDLTITQSWNNTNLQTINGAASYPSCHSFEFEFPDPRCRPLILFSGNNQFVAIRWDGETEDPQQVLDLGNTYPAPGNSVQRSMSITHIFDFNFNTGWMWISRRPTPAITNVNFQIYEWSIDDEDFNLTFNRVINVSASGTTFRHNLGIASLDRNTLIIETWSGGTGPYNNQQNYREFIGQLDITPALGNNLSLVNNMTLMFRLPAQGDSIYTGTRSTVIYSNFYLGPDNKLVIFARDSTNLSQTGIKYLLQYEYVQSTNPNFFAFPEVYFPYPDPQNPGNGVTNFIATFLDEIRSIRLTNNAPGFGNAFSQLLFSPTNYLVTGSNIDEFWTPPNGRGPFGASSINSSPEAIALCNPLTFTPNLIVTTILPTCPVFFVTRADNNDLNPNRVFYYNVNDNESIEIELPNIPTITNDRFWDIAYNSVSQRLYLLHGSNQTTDVRLTWWNVDFISGFVITPNPTSVTLQNPEPLVNGNPGLFAAALGVSEDGLNVFLSTRPSNSNTWSIRRFDTVSQQFITPAILTLPVDESPTDIAVVNNNRMLIGYGVTNPTRWMIKQIYLDGSFTNAVIEETVTIFNFPESTDYGSGIDLFLTDQNRLYIAASYASNSSNVSDIYEVDIYGNTTSVYSDTGLGRVSGAASSPSCSSFSFQSLCNPLMLWLAPTSQTHRLRVSRYALGLGEPTFLNLGTSYNPNILGLGSLVETLDIAHSFDFITNTGFLWIKKVANTNVTYINEWTINDEYYNLTWSRLITLNTSNNNGVISRIDQGMAYISPNTLAMGAIVGGGWAGCPTASCRGVILQVNITNNSITFTNCTVMFNLPVVGSVNYNGTTNLLVWSGMYFMDNSLIITAKYGSTLVSASPMYILEYPYVIGATPSLIQEIGPNYTQPAVSHFPMTMENGVYLIRNENTNWSVFEYETSFPNGVSSVYQGLTFNGVTGPHGVSSINSTAESLQLCEPIALTTDLCEECGFYFDIIETGNIGYIVAGNLLSTCQGNISDYVINWYGPNSTTEIAFTSGLGNQFIYDYPHPLTGEQSPIVLSGEYLPVIDRINLGGVIYSQDGSNGSIATNLSCFESIEVTCADCLNGNSDDPIYSYEFSFDGAIVGTQTPPFQTCLSLPSTVNHIAWAFTGFAAYDNIKIIYNGNNYTQPVILANFNIGSTLIPMGTMWTNYEIDVAAPSFSKVTSLTGLLRSPGFENIIFQITSPSGASNWILKYDCMETFDCENCPQNQEIENKYKIDSSSISTTSYDGNNQPIDFSASCYSKVVLGIKVCDEDCSTVSIPQTLFNYYPYAFSPYTGPKGYALCNFPPNDTVLFGGNEQLTLDGLKTIQLNPGNQPYNCLSLSQTSTISYNKYVDGDYWIIEVTSNSNIPIDYMYQSYLNAMNEISYCGYMDCNQDFPGVVGQTCPFSGGTSINGIPSYSDPTDYRYYRSIEFGIPTASGNTLCGEILGGDTGGSTGTVGNTTDTALKFQIHVSAVVTTGTMDGLEFYLKIENYGFLESNTFTCSTSPNFGINIINFINNSYYSDDVQFTSQTGAIFESPFTTSRRVYLTSCNPRVSYNIAGLFDTNLISNATLPFYSQNESLPEFSSTTCTNFVGMFNTYFPNIVDYYMYKYRLEIIDSNTVDFNIYAYPIVNGIWQNTPILILTYVNGVVTFSDPNYVY